MGSVNSGRTSDRVGEDPAHKIGFDELLLLLAAQDPRNARGYGAPTLHAGSFLSGAADSGAKVIANHG
jgi:hypothetical protein